MAQTASPRSTLPSPVRLEVRAGNARPAVYDVGEGGFLVGTVPGCDLRVAGANLPPLLLLIARAPGRANLRKLAPVLPLAVNGQSASSSHLADGDKITLGPVEIVVRLDADQLGEAPPTAPVPADLDARLRKFAELETQLRRQREELDAERAQWTQKREEILAECRKRQQELEAIAPPADRDELDRRELALAGREADLARQQEEMNALREELTTIRRELSQRYQTRRDRLLAQHQGIRRAARKIQQRKQRLDGRETGLAAREQQWALREAEIEALGEQVERERQLLDDQHRLLASRQQEFQRDLSQRVEDMKAREEGINEDRAALEKGQKQHQTDLVRLDRIQASIEARQKQLEARALEVDRGYEKLQRESRELEEQASQLDEWHNRLASETERLAGQKKEQDATATHLDQRAAALEGQQAMLATLRTRLERMREELRRQEQALSDQRVLQEASENDLRQRIDETNELREALDNDKKLFEEERRRFSEQQETMQAAVTQLRAAQTAVETEQAALAQREQELDRTAADQTEQAGTLVARARQLDELHQRLTADREALESRETNLRRAEETIAGLQEQLRRRSEELNDRQKQVVEGETKFDQERSAYESERKAALEEQQSAQQQLEALRHDLAQQVVQLEEQGQELHNREVAFQDERERFSEIQRSLGTQRQALASERIGWEVEKQAAQEAASRTRLEFDTARNEANGLLRRLPDLEVRAAAALDRLGRARDQLREHLAEVHTYAKQSREDLDGARRHVQAEAERVRQQELDLQVARDEHRLAVAAFRQQLIEWQGAVGEMKQSLQLGETQIEQRRAEVDQQAQRLAQTSAKLAEQAEQLQLAQKAVAERRGEVDRHLGDMREWYRRKLREVAGLDGDPGSEEAGDGDVPATGAERPAVLPMTGDLDPADRQLGELLRSLELVDGDTLVALWREAQRQRRPLRQVLLAGGYLTLFQIALIEAGNLDGLVLGPVRVIDRLAATPREAVYRVYDPRADREALLRHLDEAELHDAVHPDEFRQRFLAAAAVRHPHVAEVHEVLEIAGRPAVLGELVAGLPGNEWPALAAAPGAWYRLVNQAALALHAVHSAGLMHGHLATSSFVLTAAGTLKLTGVGEPRWLAGLAASDEPESPATDLVALGRVAAAWAALATVGGKGTRAKGLPDELQAVVGRLQIEGSYPGTQALLEDLEQAGAAVPASNAAWERLLRQVRDAAVPAAPRTSGAA